MYFIYLSTFPKSYALLFISLQKKIAKVMADYCLELSQDYDPIGMAAMENELDYEPENTHPPICSSPESESSDNSTDEDESSDSEHEKEEGEFSYSSDDSFPLSVSSFRNFT